MTILSPVVSAPGVDLADVGGGQQQRGEQGPGGAVFDPTDTGYG
jgi:hypothetical protein